MIYYNSNTINDWNFGDDNIAKVYYGVTTSGSSRLPSGYTEVEYVQNNTQGAYLNLGVKLYETIGNSYQITARYKSEYMPNWSSGGYLQTIINSEGVSSPYYGMVFRYAYNTHVLELAGNVNDTSNITWTNTDNGDGTSALTISSNSTVNADQVPLGLFASYEGNYTTPYRWSNTTIYSMQITLNNELVRDLIPCKRNSDNMVGMYDVVNDVFYYPPNYQSYQLIAGSAVTPSSSTTVGNIVYQKVEGGSTPPTPVIPSGYTEVEYIESPRKSEYPYIDTGFMPNQNTRVIADFQYTDTNTHPRCFGCGVWNSVGYIFNAENGISSNGEWKWKFGANGNTWLSTNVVPNFNRHTVEINNGNLYIDNTLIGSTTVTTFQLTDNIGLFGFIQNGSLGGTNAGEYMTGKFYSFKIYDNGTLVRDFVPCKRDNDNVYGMYDIVGGSFYTSPNNYLFSGGSAVTPSSSTPPQTA